MFRFTCDTGDYVRLSLYVMIYDTYAVFECISSLSMGTIFVRRTAENPKRDTTIAVGGIWVEFSWALDLCRLVL